MKLREQVNEHADRMVRDILSGVAQIAQTHMTALATIAYIAGEKSARILPLKMKACQIGCANPDSTNATQIYAQKYHDEWRTEDGVPCSPVTAIQKNATSVMLIFNETADQVDVERFHERVTGFRDGYESKLIYIGDDLPSGPNPEIDNRDMEYSRDKYRE